MNRKVDALIFADQSILKICSTKLKNFKTKMTSLVIQHLLLTQYLLRKVLWQQRVFRWWRQYLAVKIWFLIFLPHVLFPSSWGFCGVFWLPPINGGLQRLGAVRRGWELAQKRSPQNCWYYRRSLLMQKRVRDWNIWKFYLFEA